MPELYENMGFRENPFSRFSAEEEKDYLDKIFVRPKYYPTIHDDMKSGASRFIFGERGVGKSALVLNLMTDFEKENIFSVLIDDYEGINTRDNGKEFLLLTMHKVTTAFGLFLLKNKNRIYLLEKSEKEKLTFFINVFFETLSRDQFFCLYNNTTHIKSINFFKRCFNYILLKPVNMALSGCSEFIGSTICKALGLSIPTSEVIYKEYISELKDTAVEKINPRNFEYKSLKSMLIEISKIIRKCGFSSVVVIYDKIDEYRQLGTKSSLIADFVKDMVLDTALLLNEHISLK